MPIQPRDLHLREVDRGQKVRDEFDIPFDDLVYLLAEGVADAQTKLDVNTAELVETLAETEVDVVPRLTRTVAEDGTITTETAQAESQSLLALGFTPARYQFSEATIEVNVDMRATESETSNSEAEGRHFGLRAGTYEVTEQRKYDHEINANTTFTARLEPTPLPINSRPTGDEEENAD